MIVRCITVSGWRCFLDEFKIGPFSDRLNIISAPNGTGKTTIFEALRCAFLDGHKSSGRDVEALRPWGRALIPRVAVEFTSKGTDYRISKNFLDSPKSLLERMEGGTFRKLAEGNQADDQVRTLLVQDPQSKKFSKPENWGLAQVLWAPQGSLEVGSLSGALVADIRAVLSQHVVGAGAYDRKIQERYDRYFTPTGRLKSGSIAPAISHIQSDLTSLRKQLGEWRESYNQLDQISRKATELRCRSADLSGEVASLEKLIEVQEGQAKAYEKLLSEKNKRQLQAVSLEAQHQAISQSISAIADLEKEIKSTKSLVVQIEADLPGKKDEAEKARRKSSELSESLATARNRKKELEVQRSLARSAGELQQATKEFVHVEKSLTDAEQLSRSLKELHEERTSIVAPDRETLVSIRKFVKDRDEASLKIEASLIRLEITPEIAGTLDVLSGENPGAISLEPNRAITVKGTPEVVAVLPGVAKLRASGPTGSLEKSRKTHEKAIGALEELTRPYDTNDIAELEALLDRADGLDAKIREVNIQLAVILGEKTLVDLQEQKDSLSTKMSSILRQNPVWEQSPPDPLDLENKSRELEVEVESAISGREKEAEAAKEQSLRAHAEVEKSQSAWSDKSVRLSELARKLADQSTDDKSLDARNQERSHIAMEWEAAKASLKIAQEALDKLGEDPSGELAQLKTKLHDIKSQAEVAHDEASHQAGVLTARTESAPYSKLAEIEENIADLETRERGEQLRIDAIRMLKDMVDQCRNTALQAVTAPVENRASEIFKTISDDRLGHVRLDEHFQPVGVLPTIIDEKVGLDNLSGGELEQIHLATRLALAETLKKDDRQVVILDDILTATDSIRIQKVMDVFEEASKDLQIVILTCHPERYSKLKAAKNFDLQSYLP